MPTTITADPYNAQPISAASAVPEQISRRSRDLTWYLVLVLVWTSSALYSGRLLKRGWIPLDEGTIGQCAERVLHGELPHRDFKDPYTGGLAYLNALAFSVLGTNSVSPRIVMFLFFMGFVPVIFLIASRFTSALGAAGATLISVAWSLPNYSAAMPSWYNLFFAAFGALATLRFLETNRRRWIFLAGVCGGLSCLFKITGVYFIGAVCLTLIFRELCLPTAEAEMSGSRAYSIFLKSVFVLISAALFVLVRKNLSAVAVVQFLVPGLALAGLCLWRDSIRAGIRSALRFRALLWGLAAFSIGLVLPISLFLLPYIRSGSVRELLIGVFVLPARRLDSVTLTEIPGLPQIISTLVLAGLLAVAMYSRQILKWPFRLAIVAVLFTGLVLARSSPAAYQFAFAPLRMMVPVCVLGGTLRLARKRHRDEISPLRQQQVMLLLSVAALCSLVQVPYGAASYFCYAAPLLVIAMVSVLSVGERRSAFLVGCLALFYTAFAVLWFTPNFIVNMGRHYVPDNQSYPVNLPRAGGLRVDVTEGKTYETLIHLVQEHAQGTNYVYCAPDCPEVPFFSGLKNPTGVLFDFFENPEGNSERVLRGIDSLPVKVVVIAQHPMFSQPMKEELHEVLSSKFPKAEQVGDFEVRWRDR